MARSSYSLSLSLSKTSILSKIKEGYLFWMGIVPHIPRTARYTLGIIIENKFLDLLESSYTSYFSGKDKKLVLLSECIFTADILKFLVTTCWEGKFISNRQYESMSTKLDEIGKMLYGWKKSLEIPTKPPPIKRGKE